MASRRKGYGIFGGLFDPPHIGHLIIAQYVREEFDLEKIVFVPAGQPPHKGSYTPFRHRYRMTEMAIAHNPDFLISAVERKFQGTTYTVDVLRKLRRSIKQDLFLIIGADQWEEIRTWKDPAGIFRIARVIVVARPGHRIAKSKPYFRDLLISKAPRIDISSTRIRRLAAAGRTIRYLTPNPVIRYIAAHRINDLWRQGF
jgi:nicotinate-nucleotide adenylyltransferase